ncbi:MAG TPA: DUF2807 domain-containing protein [Chitinophagaceae bacterium]|nr:DUF2807 domain-containing protein [Chitinophagaceae bacterium]
MKNIMPVIMHKHQLSFIISLCVFSIMVSSFTAGRALPAREISIVKRAWPLPANCGSICIDGDISLVLTNDTSASVAIEGKEKDISAIQPVMENGVLFINAAKRFSFAKRTVYLPAMALQLIRLNGNGDISSAGYINTHGLHIILNGNITVKVKTRGAIQFDAPDEIEVKKKTACAQPNQQPAYLQPSLTAAATTAVVTEEELPDAPCGMLRLLLPTLL